MTHNSLLEQHEDLSARSEHAKISVEYAISVLEEVKQKCANSFFHKSPKIFEDKIEELKKLL